MLFSFLLYNNESHFVITKYCYNALYSHYCLQSFFENIILYMSANI